MERIGFIAATYNEENEIMDLLRHVRGWVDCIRICDDSSTDRTINLLERAKQKWVPLTDIDYKVIPHTGLPETVKNEALKMLPDYVTWVLMLDADERFITPIREIAEWVDSSASKEVDYVYFNQYEIIDNQHVRTFQKSKLFRKNSITFSENNIHADDQFAGEGAFFGWNVAHRKSTSKQVTREMEYLDTYKRLLDEGKIDEGRYNWLVGLHHYVKPKV